jgi:hypothetical protein
MEKGEDMDFKKIPGITAGVMVLAAFLSLAYAADDASDTSDSVMVMLDADSSSFWRTATNNVVTLPIDYPDFAKSAKLIVEGNGYSRTIENVPEGDYVLELPAATDPGTENVYNLTLAFSDGTERKCSFAVIEGAGVGDSGSGRLLLPKGAGRWQKVDMRAVMPVPFGTKAVMLGDEELENPLDGAQGWLAFGPLAAGIGVDAAITLESGEVLSADLLGRSNAIQIRVK